MPESQAFTGQNKIKMYATTWCGDCRMAKRWFDEHGIPYDYSTIETDERAAAYVLRINRGMRSVPTSSSRMARSSSNRARANWPPNACRNQNHLWVNA